MTTPYVYKLTDTVTGKWYIGSRTAKGCYPEELGVRYFSSSKLVEPIYRCEPSRFKSEIIVVSEDSDFVIKVESDMLKFRLARTDPMSYNMHNGDGRYNPHKSGKRVAEENRRLGKAIFSQTRDQKSEAGKKGGTIAGSKGGKTQGERNKYNGVLVKARASVDREKQAESARKVLAGFTKEELIEYANKAVQNRARCLVCGMITNSGSLARHQKASGHEGKERIK